MLNRSEICDDLLERNNGSDSVCDVEAMEDDVEAMEDCIFCCEKFKPQSVITCDCGSSHTVCGECSKPFLQFDKNWSGCMGCYPNAWILFCATEWNLSPDGIELEAMLEGSKRDQTGYGLFSEYETRALDPRIRATEQLGDMWGALDMAWLNAWVSARKSGQTKEEAAAKAEAKVKDADDTEKVEYEDIAKAENAGRGICFYNLTVPDGVKFGETIRMKIAVPYFCAERRDGTGWFSILDSEMKQGECVVPDGLNEGDRFTMTLDPNLRTQPHQQRRPRMTLQRPVNLRFRLDGRV